jgi:hypothetical protein
MVLEDAFDLKMPVETEIGTDNESRAMENATEPLETPTTSELAVEMGFWLLPLEIQQQTLENLDRSSVKAFCLVNWRAWHIGIGFVWRDVKLIDCRTRHQVPEEYKPWREYAAGAEDEPGAGYDPMEGQDEHDDTPILRKLLVLAR